MPFHAPRGQALERQKEYFDCIRSERDELRDELADLKGKSKTGEVGVLGVQGHASQASPRENFFTEMGGNGHHFKLRTLVNVMRS